MLKKAVKSFNIVFRLKSTLHTESLSHIFKTYILPIIEYACIPVTPLSIAALDRLERIQRKAARICLRLPLYTPLNHSTLLHRLTWPTMYSRRKVKLTLLAYSIKYQYAPQHICMLNTPAQVTAQYSLRHARTWHLPPSRTDSCKDSPLYKSLEYYNALPASIRDVSSRPAFKQEICSLLTAICSCSAHPLPYL